MNPTISIIIPTYKRASILTQCLEYLERQTIAHAIEVIVVSDGHDEPTCELFKTKTWKIPVSFFEVEKSQQGCARNRGLKEAHGEYCLFTGDDMFLAPETCEKHIEDHKRLRAMGGSSKQYAVLGFTTWDPECGITNVMEWLEKSGWQFGYPRLKKHEYNTVPQNIQHLYSYTSNISMSTSTARAHKFRDDLTFYGWEDIEWGMRLQKSNIQLYYDPRAKVLHHHHISMEDSLKRMRTLGESAVIAKQKVPEMDRLPEGVKKIAYQISALFPTMAGKHRRAFLEGIEIGMKE